MIRYSRVAVLLIVDMIIVNFSYIMAFLLRFEFDVNSSLFNMHFAVYGNNILAVTIIQIVALALFGVYTSMWRYAGSEELVKVALGSMAGAALVISYMSLTQQMLPRSIYPISCMMIMLLVAGSRLVYRWLRNMRNPGTFNSFVLRVGRKDLFGKDVTKVMLVGAGDAGASIVKEIKQHPEYGQKVVAAIDDDPVKQGTRLHGVKVVGGRDRIKQCARKYGADEIIVAIPSANNRVIKDILNECNKTRCKIKVLPGLIDLINNKVSVSNLRNVDIEDLLGRDPVKVNLREISGYIEGKIVLVTGAGGSIGSELCRQIVRFKPRRLIALDIYENTIFELENEIKTVSPYTEFEVAIGSICDRERMAVIFDKYKPHVVFHAAAHKHVPLMEKNPGEALTNNVIGTKNLLDLAEEYIVEKFVMISTDKAVNPTNVMGATKRICEMMLQEKSKNSQTRYSAVRFGNVLGSNGSVIPLFRKQIAAGGPVTVTHKDITRYFMTIPEAVQLVIQTGAMADGGEIFVLDMGEPVRIMDLAENVIKLSGYVPNEDIEIKITGLRPGEKLFEELLLDDENIEKTMHEKIYVGHPLEAEPALLEMLRGDGDHTIEREIAAVAGKSPAEIKEWISRVVPNYMPQ